MIMSQRRILIGVCFFVSFAVLMGIIVKQQIFTDPPRISVSIKEVSKSRSTIAFIKIKANHANVGMEEISERAKKEAQKLGGKAKLLSSESALTMKGSALYVGPKKIHRETEAVEKLTA
ncbi:MAG: hypothetical protein ACLFTS_02255, partial [Candidatus Paceibacterota bacterium]